MTAELPIVLKVYDIIKVIGDINDQLPKTRRYNLGDETLKNCWELQRQILIAKHAPKTHKSIYLLRAESELEVLQLRLRLYLETTELNTTRIFEIQAMIQEAGRMLGGWLKSVK